MVENTRATAEVVGNMLKSHNRSKNPRIFGFQILRMVPQVAQIETILEYLTQLFDLENGVGSQKV